MSSLTAKNLPMANVIIERGEKLCKQIDHSDPQTLLYINGVGEVSTEEKVLYHWHPFTFL